MTDEVKKIMSHSKISTLSSLVSALHRSGWSPENTLLPTSFPAVKYTKVENIPLKTPHVSAVAEKYHYSYEESFFDDFNNSGFSRVESSPFDLSPESIYSSSLPDENVDIDIELGLGLSQDIENWFDIVERNFEETPDMKSNLSPHIDSTVV